MGSTPVHRAGTDDGQPIGRVAVTGPVHWLLGLRGIRTGQRSPGEKGPNERPSQTTEQGSTGQTHGTSTRLKQPDFTHGEPPFLVSMTWATQIVPGWLFLRYRTLP